MPFWPFRQRAPHPDALVCPCGWRQPVRLYPVFTFDKEPKAKIVSIRVTITCPDCGLEHVASSDD